MMTNVQYQRQEIRWYYNRDGTASTAEHNVMVEVYNTHL